MKESLGSRSNGLETSKESVENGVLGKYLLGPHVREPAEVLGYRIEAGRFIDTFHKQADIYEEKHSLEDLCLITEMNPADAPSHPLREPARIDLIMVVALLNFIKDQTDISEEEYKKLQKRYRTFSDAVGFINGNTHKVRHE